jgi:hypothetical protein
MNPFVMHDQQLIEYVVLGIGYSVLVFIGYQGKFYISSYGEI